MSMKKMLTVVAAAALVAVAAPAFAANPFSDVPMNHWAYDAVESLSAKGILDGYPNGTFKGNKAMTRYEIATVVARAMANGAAGPELEKLKALVVEFQPELEALGVKVDGFDSRIAKLEKGVGNLRIWGQMRYDFRAWDDQDASPKKNGWNFNRARLFMHKDLSDGVSWEMRWHNDVIDRYWVTLKDAFGMKGLRVKLGAFAHCWETEDNLQQSNAIWDDDANFYDTTIRGAQVTYVKGGFTVDTFAASNKGAGAKGVYTDNQANEMFGARLKYAAAKWFVSANLYTFKDENYKAYWFALGLKPIKGLDVIGAWYKEDVDTGSDPKAWKVILDAKQDLLKFTNLRAEYSKYDEGFMIHQGGNVYTIDANGHANWNVVGSSALTEDLKVLKLTAQQKWGKKFSTYERYGEYKMTEKAKELTLGVGYQYSPALSFYLDWTKFDGQIKAGAIDPNAENKMIRFRTFLNF